jgi:hypothetical protein
VFYVQVELSEFVCRLPKDEAELMIALEVEEAAQLMQVEMQKWVDESWVK